MYLLGVKYLEALPKITEGSGTTIFLPAEATGVMGAIGAMRELLVRGGTSAARGGAAPAPRATASSPAPSQPSSPPQLGAGSTRQGAGDQDDGPDGSPVADL
jgi:hypothetical protein